jgi:hypothetical protein
MKGTEMIIILYTARLLNRVKEERKILNTKTKRANWMG